MQLLLHNPAVLALVFLQEDRRWDDAHLVVGQPEDEAQDEKFIPEREHAIVDGDVVVDGPVVDTDGRMSVKAPCLGSGTAGEQADVDGVHRLKWRAMAVGDLRFCG